MEKCGGLSLKQMNDNIKMEACGRLKQFVRRKLYLFLEETRTSLFSENLSHSVNILLNFKRNTKHLIKHSQGKYLYNFVQLLFTSLDFR